MLARSRNEDFPVTTDTPTQAQSAALLANLVTSLEKIYTRQALPREIRSHTISWLRTRFEFDDSSKSLKNKFKTLDILATHLITLVDEYYPVKDKYGRPGFEKFEDFPTEIRELIWDHAAAAERILEVDFTGVDDELSFSHEARNKIGNIAKASYHSSLRIKKTVSPITFRIEQSHSGYKKQVLWHQKADILYLPYLRVLNAHLDTPDDDEDRGFVARNAALIKAPVERVGFRWQDFSNRLRPGGNRQKRCYKRVCFCKLLGAFAGLREVVLFEEVEVNAFAKLPQEPPLQILGVLEDQSTELKTAGGGMMKSIREVRGDWMWVVRKRPCMRRFGDLEISFCRGKREYELLLSERIRHDYCR